MLKYTILAIVAFLLPAVADAGSKHQAYSEHVIDQRQYHEVAEALLRKAIPYFFDGKRYNGRPEPEEQFIADYVTDAENEMQGDFISDYVTTVPNESKFKLSGFESVILPEYLDAPNNADLAQLLAAYHVIKSKTYHRPGRYRKTQKATVKKLKHTIYASYFLHRAKALNVSATWVDYSLIKVQKRLAEWLPVDQSLDYFIGSDAHNFFLDAFTKREYDRYRAEYRLVKELIRHPMRIHTNLYISAANLWNGSEAYYDDPAMLYFYVLATYFGERQESLVKASEQQWLGSKEGKQLYELAPETGFFTIPPRRWLANLHGNQAAKELIEIELDEWFQRLPQFYGFPTTVFKFIEPENFAEGYERLFSSFDICASDPIRVCTNTGKAPYNLLATITLAADFYMKAGNADLANAYLGARFNPAYNFSSWTLGKEAWLHREDNLGSIIAHYQDDDPSNDPVNLFINHQKWGVSNSCQLCHQHGDNPLSDEETYARDENPSIDRIFIGDWPDYTVTWYGEIIQ